MWPQEPGSFTRIIAAMVAPRNTSSETKRPGRDVSAAAGMLEVDVAIVSDVAMAGPSNGGDSTADAGMPQCRSGERVHKKTWPGGGGPATFFARGKKLSRIPVRGSAFSDKPDCARRKKSN
jgi:hypothetical protein